ncbi:hypothetical protein GXB85_16120 [Cellulomonas sp. APG4]|uniref:beta strand repeat-containing protein n=1 Tax=Cellulomonas sp. APG4 TaxID=1538656 RepID=UPI00137B4F33|nr:putative Ig domain-containing protein [Cellulomonas sp. APG4]NCT92463.1 hypothetical protein [Cellulomonas sp. APG4]
MRPSARLRRATAAFTTAALALTMLAAGLVAPATAAGVGVVIDDFSGTSMGTRTLVVQQGYSCDVTGNTTQTPGAGTLRLEVRVPDSVGCPYAQAQVLWTASGTVDIAAGGADRIEMRYRDVLPNQTPAVTFGLRLTDVNGRVATVGGLSRNGGAASDWLTVRYTPAYEGDVAVLSFQSGFDRTQVKSVALLVAATTSNQNVAVTLEELRASNGEPVYQAPAFTSTAPLVFPPSTSTTRTVTVTGNPAPDVSVTSATPSWMTVSTSKSSSATTVTLSGNPGTAYAETSLSLHANVAGSLTADATIPVVVPSPVTVGYSSANATLGEAGLVTLGTATSTPGSRILGPTTGLPPGTALEVHGSDVRLVGAPTSTGTFTVATTVGNDYRSAPFSRQVVVGATASVDAVADQHVVLGESLSLPLTVAGYPAPSVDVTGLPDGVTYADGVIAGTPTSSGAHAVTVDVTNAWGSGSTSFAMTVGPRPTVTTPAATLVTAGEATALPVAVSGAPDDVTATGLPDGLALAFSASTASITGTPSRPTSAAQTSGTATITATNAFATATTDWSWTVQAAPELAGPATVSTTLGTPFTGAQVVATGFPTPEVSVQGAADLPAGVSLDLTTPGVVSVVGTPFASGTAVLEITADNGVGAPVVRTLTVRALVGPSFVDAAPRLTLAAGSTDELTLAWAGDPVPTLSLGSALPSWLTFDDTSGRFVASPGTDVAGVFGPYAVTATNPAGSAVADVTVEVTAPPTVVRELAGLVGPVGTPVAGLTIATYRGHPTPDVTVSGLPAGLTATTTGGVVTIAGTPTEGGDVVATITATNAHGSDSAPFPIEIHAPPTLSAPATVTVPQGVATTLPVTVGGYPRPLLVADGLPDGLVVDGAAGTITGTPVAPGASEVRLSLTRGGTPVAGSDVTVTVHVTAAPTFVTPPTRTTTRLGSPVDVAAFVGAGYPVPTASAAGLPTGLTLSQSGASVRLVGTPMQTGTFDVDVELENPHGTQTATWRVVVEDPAGVTAPAAAVVVADQAITPIAVGATGYPAPTVTATGLPDGLSVVTDGSGTRVVGVPTEAGRHTVTLTATNGVGAPSTTTLTLDVHQAPDLGDDRTASFPAGATSSLALAVAGYPAPTLTTSALPSWLTFDAAAATFTGAPTSAHVGAEEVVEVTATSAAGSDTVEIAFTVTAAPAVVERGGTTTVRAGDAVDVALTAVSGYPRPTVTTDGLPTGLDVTLVAGELRLVGTTTVAGTHAVTLTLTNGSGGGLLVPWTVVVEEVVVDLSVRSAPAGGGVDIRATGLQPNETVEVWLHSTPRLLATTTADAAGGLRLAVRIPADTPAGQHTVVVKAASGVVVSVPIRVLPQASSPTAGGGAGSTATNGGGVAETTGSGSSRQGLAATGSDVGGLLALSLLSLTAGAAILVGRRRPA